MATWDTKESMAPSDGWLGCLHRLYGFSSQWECWETIPFRGTIEDGCHTHISVLKSCKVYMLCIILLANQFIINRCSIYGFFFQDQAVEVYPRDKEVFTKQRALKWSKQRAELYSSGQWRRTKEVPLERGWAILHLIRCLQGRHGDEHWRRCCV